MISTWQGVSGKRIHWPVSLLPVSSGVLWPPMQTWKRCSFAESSFLSVTVSSSGTESPCAVIRIFLPTAALFLGKDFADAIVINLAPKSKKGGEGLNRK